MSRDLSGYVEEFNEEIKSALSSLSEITSPRAIDSVRYLDAAADAYEDARRALHSMESDFFRKRIKETNKDQYNSVRDEMIKSADSTYVLLSRANDKINNARQEVPV